MTRIVAILAFDEMEALDFAGPFEVFTTATRVAERWGEDAPFEVLSIAGSERVRARAGLNVVVDRSFVDLNYADVVVVPGGVTSDVERDQSALDWLVSVGEGAELVASVCTGAFVLAAAGVATTEAVTTHWEDADDLATRYPRLDVRRSVRWVDAGRLVTSAGISAGIDMSLHLVERLTSRVLAEATARQMDYDWREVAKGPGPTASPVVTVFRSRLRPGVERAYGDVAAEMSRLVRTMPGFVDEKFYLSPDGERVTIVRFTDADAQRAWSRHESHRAAQERGRREFYSWYDISVGGADYARVFGVAVEPPQSSA